MMTLLDLWPTHERFREFLNALDQGDAEAVLAVHQPIYLRSFDNAPILDQAFLQILLSEKERCIFTVTGTAKAGRHFRHWLEAQMARQKNEPTQKTLLTFPSSDSREKFFDELKAEFPDAATLQSVNRPASARTEISAEQVRDRFIEALEKAEAEAKQRLADSKSQGVPAGSRDRDLGTWLAKGLRDYLGDPITAQPFLASPSGPIYTLAEAIAANSAETRGLAPFRVEHWLRQAGVDILRASHAAQQFYKKLNMTSDQFRAAATQLLNELTSQILAELAPPELPALTEIIERVQQELRAGGRELVIVIEQVDEPGDLSEVAAAGQQWQIETQVFANPSEWVDALGDLVAVYLNAARNAVTDLELEYQQRVEVFGRSKNGLSFFPLNRSVLEQWVQSNRSDLPVARLAFDLLEKLISLRETFAAQQFPPANLWNSEAEDLEPEIRDAIEKQYPAQAGRYVALLTYWAGRPKTLDEIQLSEHVYRAFNLEPLVIAAAPEMVPASLEVEAVPFHDAFHPEVQAFFDAVRTTGARLELLTETVRQWLMATQQDRDFVIVPKHLDEEISCGLS